MGLGDAAELAFPTAIEDDPVDVTAAGVSLPEAGFGGGELHVDGGTGGIVGIEHGLDGAAIHFGAGDGGGDALASHVGQRLIEELGGIRAAGANEAGIEPLFGNSLELSEEIELRFCAGIAPILLDEPLGE